MNNDERRGWSAMSEDSRRILEVGFGMGVWATIAALMVWRAIEGLLL